MSKLLDLMQRISDGAPARLGFGAARAGSLPGMALVGLVADEHQKGVSAATEVGLDAVIVCGVEDGEGLKSLGEFLSESRAESQAVIPWGAYVAGLSEEAAQACRDGGGDLMAFTLEGTTAAAIAGEDDLARILSVAPDLDDRELRAIAALPVDIFTLDMNVVSGSWTLQDLVKVGAISRRVDKYILVEVSRVPGNMDLEALRDMGVSGLLVNLDAVSRAELVGLRAALLEMPRPGSRHRYGSRRRERLQPTLPGSSLAPAHPPAREDAPDEDDDDYRDLSITAP